MKNVISKKSSLLSIVIISLSLVALMVYALESHSTAQVVVNVDIALDGVTTNLHNATNVSKGNIILNATSNATASNMTFSFFYAHNNSLVNISTINSTFAGATANLTFNLTRNLSSFLSDGLYIVMANQSATAANSSFANITRRVLLDTVAPEVSSITTPTDRVNFTNNTGLTNFNVSLNNGSTPSGVNVSDIHQVYFSLTNGNNGSIRNYTALAANATLYNVTINVSALAEGNYTVAVWANDTAGNMNNTTTITFLLDRTAPDITSVNNLSISSSTVTLNWTTDEVSNSSILYGTTTALTSGKNSSVFETQHVIALTGLANATRIYYNVTSCNSVRLCNTTGPYNFTTAEITLPSSVSSSTSGGGSGSCSHGYSKVNGRCVKDTVEETPAVAEAEETPVPTKSSGASVEETVQQQEQELPTQVGGEDVDQAGRGALAGKAVDGGFAQTLKDLSGLWIAVVVVVVVAGVLFGVYRNKSSSKGPSRK